MGVRLAGCIGIALALASLAAVGVGTGFLEGFRERAGDSAFPRGGLDPSIVVVGVDERALAAIGPWPWPRSTQAELIRRIASASPAVTVVDVVYAPAADGDEVLGEAVAAAPTVVAGLVSIGGDDDGLLLAEAATPPVPVVADAATVVGHAAVAPDPNDGVVRNVPLVVDVDGVLVPSLALAAVAVVEGAPPDVIVRPDAVQVGGRTIPTDGLHRLRVSWPEDLGVEGGAIVSAADLLDGSFDPQALGDRVVLVGVTDPSVGDDHPTPTATAAGEAGVLIQAAAYNTMATRAYLDTPSTFEVAVWVFAVSLVVALSVQFTSIWVAVAATLLVALASVLAAYARTDRGVLGEVVYPLAAIAVTMPASGGLRYATEARRRREVARLFAQYVPEPVAEQLVEQGRVEAATSGQRVEITVLFCDLRGFTAMSSGLEPSEVNERLTHYYEYASAIVLDAGGTLVQYVGDEVFAVFGAPVPDEQHAAHGVDCARRLQEEVQRLDDDLAAIGADPLRFGIGVNSGEVVAAHSGSRVRRQYTVIGDAVNVGSRLCSQAGPGQVVLSDGTLRRIDPPPRVAEVGPLTMKGVRADFVAWRLVLDHEPHGTSDRVPGTGG